MAIAEANASASASGGFTLTVKYGHSTETLQFPDSDPEAGRVVAEICSRLGLEPSTLKLLGVAKGAILANTLSQGLSATAIGFKNGAKIMVMGSKASEVQTVRQSEAVSQALRLPGFEHEATVAAARRRSARNVQPPPFGTKYTFGSYEVLRTAGLHPGPEEALKLLYRLASDPGILSVMSKHQFTVGKLAEMPPEGLVGVDPVCVLGLNTNKGECIHLRLRTDDLKGFRKYESIRLTLCHELTHNVWGAHDNNFKALCSQLNREVEEVHARLKQTGRFASGQEGAVGQSTADEEQMGLQLHPAMAATAASSGRTLRQLARASASPGAHPSSGTLAISAGGGQTAGQGNGTSNSSLSSGRLLHGSPRVMQGQSSPGGGDGLDDDVATMYEHFDTQTDSLEKRQRALEE